MSAMRALAISLIVVLAVLSGCVSRTPSTAGDPISGKWEGTWGPSPERQTNVVLELKWDGVSLTGTVNPGGRAIDISKASFDPKTSAIKMELEARSVNGEPDHYAIQGKVDGKKMSGTWTRNNGSGDFNITKN
jgi:hypothetical protein